MPEFDVWYDQNINASGKRGKAVVEYIQQIYLGENPLKPSASITHMETDGGILFVWRTRKAVRKIYVQNDNMVLERGVDRWPRGRTQVLDALCDILLAQMDGRDTRPHHDKLAEVSEPIPEPDYTPEPKIKMRKGMRFKRPKKS